MKHPAALLQPLNPEQITASRDRLVAEGFHPDSKAVRVHEQLLAAMQDHPRHTEAACQSMDDLKSECERLRASLEAARAHAIAQDCGRMCDGNPSLKYREQFKRSEAFVDGLIRRAVAEAVSAAVSEAA